MAKHFRLDIGPGRFAYTRDAATIDAEAALDGLYLLRTNVPAERLDTPGVVHAYKNLVHVERDFRSLKTVDVDLRPVHHYTETRVRAHVLLCMLAAYLTWRASHFPDCGPPKVHSGKGGNSCQEGIGNTRLSSVRKRPRWSTGPAPSPELPTNSG